MVRQYQLAFQTGNEQLGKARQDDAQVSFKKAYAVTRAVKGMKVPRALEYLDNVIARHECVPVFKFHGGASRHAQARMWGTDRCKWPEKAVRMVRNLVDQAAKNAKALHKLDKVDDLVVRSTDCGLAGQCRHRRNYRAHGRVNRYNSEPCHIQIMCAPVTAKVAPAKELK